MLTLISKHKQFVIDLSIILILITVCAVGLRVVHDYYGNQPASQFLLGAVFSRAQAAETDYSAYIINRSHSVVNILPEKDFTFTIEYHNAGIVNWPEYDGDSMYLKPVSGSSRFAHRFWPDPKTAARFNARVTPDASSSIRFALTAPPALGLYTERFILVDSRNTVVPGSIFEVSINVTLDPSASSPAYQPTVSTQSVTAPPTKTVTQPQVLSSSTSNQPSSVSSSSDIQNNPEVISTNILFPSQPRIRVGIDYPDNKRTTLTAASSFSVYSSDNVKQRTFGAGTLVTVQYTGGVYNLILPSGTASFSSYLTFKADDSTSPLEVTSFVRSVGWNSSINDNRFLGDIEIKYNPNTDRLWIINVLPLEDYVSGVSESSNVDVPEFQKTTAIAARTYALYHFLSNSKHGGFFHVNDDYDQVYRGYNSARRLPHYVDAVRETEGQVVTYDNEIVVTPYFTQSDGRTRSYKEVWGSGLPAPHLQSVTVPQDTGRALLGHGVGMSAQGAQRMAYLDDLDYQTILKFFYTGIEIQKVY